MKRNLRVSQKIAWVILHPFLRERERKKLRKKRERERESVFRKVVLLSLLQSEGRGVQQFISLLFQKVMKTADWLTWVRRECLETWVVHIRIGKQWHMQEDVLTRNLRKHLPGVGGVQGNRGRHVYDWLVVENNVIF